MPLFVVVSTKRTHGDIETSRKVVRTWCRLCAVLSTWRPNFESCKWTVDYLVCSSTEAVEVAIE